MMVKHPNPQKGCNDGIRVYPTSLRPRARALRGFVPWLVDPLELGQDAKIGVSGIGLGSRGSYYPYLTTPHPKSCCRDTVGGLDVHTGDML